MTDTFNGYPANTYRRQRHTRIELAPALLDALNELAAAEDIDVRLLVTLLINTGLDHRGRTC